MGEPGLNVNVLIEEFEQENYNLNREVDFVDLQINSVEEELLYEEEQMLEEDLAFEENIETLKKQIMFESNRAFEDNSLNLDSSSFHNLSTSYLDASLNVSTIMDASIYEPEEITTLSQELKEEEMSLREKKSKLEDVEFQLQEIRNQNLLAENELKNYRHECNNLKEEFKEKEEELILINAEMNFLPKLTQTDNSAQDSIYAELVRTMEVTKTELSEKKQRLSHYVSVLQQIETDCKHFEGELLVLDVYDREDETRRLQSQANLLEAYKHFHKELEKNIQTLQTSVSDIPALLHSNGPSHPDLVLRTVSQYHDYVAVRLKRLQQELTYHRMELVSVADRESLLGTNVRVLRGSLHTLRGELEELAREIHDVKTGAKKSSSENIDSRTSKEKTAKEMKSKTVRFQTNTPPRNEESEDKENDTSCVTREEGESREKKPMEKVPQQPQKIVIHKRRQNKKPVNVIKHY